MDVFLDTSVLVAASERNHPHHPRAKVVLLRVIEGRDRRYIGAHSIAEVYSTLTRLPVQPRILPAEAVRIIRENILPYFHVVVADPQIYLAAVEAAARGEWIGAKIYDVLLLNCAEACAAERVYTFNLRDFQPLAPASLQGKVFAP